MPEKSQQTSLWQRHVDAGAVMTDTDGWSLPAHYGDPEGELAEAHRRAVVIDISHIGRFQIRGNGALEFLESLCTCDVARQEDDTCQRTFHCDYDGALIDLAVLTRLEDAWLLTCSPAQRAVISAHLHSEAEAYDVKVKDTTEQTTMLQICGSADSAPKILDAVLPEQVSPLARGQCRSGSYLIAKYIALRCGLTDLWSLEVIVPNLLAGQAWRFITEKAGANALRPAGQTAREALRKQANIRTFGAGIDARTNPFDEGLADLVDCSHAFIGREALQARCNR